MASEIRTGPLKIDGSVDTPNIKICTCLFIQYIEITERERKKGGEGENGQSWGVKSGISTKYFIIRFLKYSYHK